MENASKALIIVASTLIAVILMTFMIYMFRRFGTTARNTEERYSDLEIKSFNTKFQNYDTGGNDKIGVTTYYGGVPTTQYKEVKDVLSSTGENNNKFLISLSQNLDTVYDVVSCAKDAINVNYTNNNSYKYSENIELQNSVEVIVDLGATNYNNFDFNKQESGSGHFQYLIIEPSESVDPKAQYIYGTNNAPSSSDNNTNDKQNNFASYNCNNPIKLSNMLKELRNTRNIVLDGKNYTIYQYYFTGEVFYNEFTDLIETVKFTLVKDPNFDSRG